MELFSSVETYRKNAE